MRVMRLYSTLITTPDAASAGAWAVWLSCGQCSHVTRMVPVYGIFGRYWTVDWAQIVERHVRFRCRCGWVADTLRITCETREGNETLLRCEGLTEAPPLTEDEA